MHEAETGAESACVVEANRELFVLEYLKDHNGKQAAIRAGYSARSAEGTASRLLRSAKVSAAIAAAMEIRKERVRVDTDALEIEAERIATSDIRQVIKDGKLLT